MRIIRAVLWGVSFFLLSLIPSATLIAQGTTFTVTNTNDSGAGSLRQAILDANVTPGRDTITFNIPGGGVQTIVFLTEPPSLTDAVIIDGYTQLGSAPATKISTATIRIQLTSSVQLGRFLRIQGGNTVIRGLVINPYAYSCYLCLEDIGGNVIEGNYLGLDPTGEAIAQYLNYNNLGIAVESDGNVIGGTSAAARNVIAGLGDGITFTTETDYNYILGNYIGTNAAGTISIQHRGYGISISGTRNVIGGTSPGAGNVIDSGNSTAGLAIYGTETIVQGNFIGINASGTQRLHPGGGIGILLGNTGNTVGGAESGARNVISGNYTGILVSGFDVDYPPYGWHHVIQGNFIGTDASGVYAVPNYAGIIIERNAQENTIGMDGIAPEVTGERNIIAGNVYPIIIRNAHRNRIAGNFIGLNANGDKISSGLSQNASLIYVENGNGNLIGNGTLSGRNYLSGSSLDAITVIGGVGNTISVNSIYDNGFGIRLLNNGNNDISAPLLLYAQTGREISGAFLGKPNTTYRLEYFASPTCNVSGYGEGQTFLGAKIVTTNSIGSGDATLSDSGFLELGKWITATKTEIESGSTSEFSNCVQAHMEATGTVFSTFTPTITRTPSATLTLTITSSITPTETLTPTITYTPVITLTPTTTRTPSATPQQARPDTIGIYRNDTNKFYLRFRNSTGDADITTFLSSLGMNPTEYRDVPVVGDWNGDGIDTIGFYRRGRVSDSAGAGLFTLTDSNTNPQVMHSFVLGNPGDTPLVGDWDGDGRDSVGVFRPSNGLIYIKNQLTTGFADYAMVLGNPGDIGIAGDWDDDGRDSPGVYRPGATPQFYLTNQLCNCVVFSDYTVSFGNPGDQPFTGDWNGDGRTGLGVYRTSNGITYLRNDPTTTGFSDYDFVYGIENDVAFGGVWISASPPSAQIEVAPTFQPSKP